MMGHLPVIITPGAPTQLAFSAGRGGEGWLPIPAVLQIRITVDFTLRRDGFLEETVVGARASMMYVRCQ
jgi:hypothetical protein